jgi:lipopolysaccharide/colanic/teichoic acid biosynthesis glycosyltransferase
MLSAFKERELVNECAAASGGAEAVRRSFDVTCAAAGLFFLSPLFCAIAIAIKLDDGGPVFYAQERIGKGFQPFRVYKFRTMVTGADRHGSLSASEDSRLTRTGRLLRRYKLDEFPQLFNVLRGNMQLVGPRPEVEQYVQMFRPQYAVILQNRPGITDPASLAYRHESRMLDPNRIEQQYLDEILPDKLRLSMDYQKRRSFLSDVHILLRTVFGLAK